MHTTLQSYSNTTIQHIAAVNVMRATFTNDWFLKRDQKVGPEFNNKVFSGFHQFAYNSMCACCSRKLESVLV